MEVATKKPLTSRRFLFSAIFFCLLSLLAFCAFFFAGLAGEAFIVDERGQARTAPGARVDIYRCDGAHKSALGYLLSDASGHKKYLQELTQLTEAAGRNVPAERIDLASKMSDEIYCSRLSVGRHDYFGPPVESLNADRNGRFFVRLSPGKYVIFAEGQAGNHHAIWLKDFRQRWRSDVTLVETECKYQTE